MATMRSRPPHARSCASEPPSCVARLWEQVMGMPHAQLIGSHAVYSECFVPLARETAVAFGCRAVQLVTRLAGLLSKDASRGGCLCSHRPAPSSALCIQQPTVRTYSPEVQHPPGASCIADAHNLRHGHAQVQQQSIV